jgi:hypothetical protein
MPFNRSGTYVDIGQNIQLMWESTMPGGSRVERWKRFVWMPHIYSIPGLYSWALFIPLWYPSLLFARVAGLSWQRYRRLTKLNHCIECGYSLAGLPSGSACPECGTQQS